MKRQQIIYWIATIWLSLGMVSTGVVQLMRMEQEVQKMYALGYAPYVMTLIGFWKIAGTVVVLLPQLPLVKEWAYAGFFFLMSGALVSHLAMHDDPINCFGPALLLVLNIVSWYFRPQNRKLTFTHSNL